MKKLAGGLVLILMVALLAQEVGKKEPDADDLVKQKAIIEMEKNEIKRQMDNLKSFQLELEQRALALEADKKALEEREKLLNQRLVNESVNKTTIEAYESIDPEQAAPLIISLFKEDENLTALLMRKMAAKKAGKILEAMIPLDRELSTRMSQKILTYYSDKKAPQSNPS